MGSCEVFSLQMKADLMSHLKFVRYLMLIATLLVLGIDFLHNIMNLLLDELDSLKIIGFLINLCLSMGRLFLCGCNGKIYVYGGQWLEPQAHLKRVVDNRSMEGSIVSMFNIRKFFIP
jgi:hypothetical protein